jgi:uncharacterized protein
MNRTCPACSARLDRQASTCPQCGANIAAGSANQATGAGAADQEIRNTAVAAHLSTFAGLVVPFGSVIGPLAVADPTRPGPVHRRRRARGAELRHLDRHLRCGGAGRGLDAGRHPLLVIGVIAWVVLASLAAAKASQGQAYRYPLTMRLVR